MPITLFSDANGLHLLISLPVLHLLLLLIGLVGFVGVLGLLFAGRYEA